MPAGAPSGLLSRDRVVDRRGRPLPIVGTLDARTEGAARVVRYTAAVPQADWAADVEVVVDAESGALRTVSATLSQRGYTVHRAADIGPAGLPSREVVDVTPPPGGPMWRAHVVYELAAPRPCVP